MPQGPAADASYHAFDAAPAGVLVINHDFHVLFWNRWLEERTGIDRGRIVGSSLTALLPLLNKPKYRDTLSSVFGGGSPAVFLFPFFSRFQLPALPAAKLPLLHITVSPVMAKNGSGHDALCLIQDANGLRQSFARREPRPMLAGCAGEGAAEPGRLNERLLREISQRERAERSLMESESKFRSIFDNLSVGIALIDEQGAVRALNGAFCRFLNCRESEAQGYLFSGFIHHEDREAGAEEHAELVAGKRDAYVVHKRFLRVNGEVAWARLTVSGIRAADRALRCTAVVCEDITERKAIEAELFKVQKLESLGVLAGGIAHDFNNLLTAILGNASSAKRLLEPGSTAHMRIAEAEKASLRARELTRQLLTFSKGGSPVRKTAGVGDLIRESATFVLRGTDLGCDFSLPDDLWPVEVDEGRINQVLNNILINAREAMPTGGKVHIKAENAVTGETSSLPLSGGLYVKITVRDEGPGIPDSVIDRIFDPYFTTKPSGTGLGLATSFTIIRSHGGHITAASEPGRGTVFTIYLPAVADKALHRRSAELPIAGNGRVLLIDDEEIVRAAAGLMLKDLGYEPELARDGREALEAYQRATDKDRPFHSVIIDLTIPGGMGGRETIKALTRLNPGVKALVSSGYSNDPIMAEFRKYGFHGVIEKPYTLEELGRALFNLKDQDPPRHSC